MTVEGESLYSFRNCRLKVSLRSAEGDASAVARRLAASSVLAADAEKLKFPFLIRGWNSGDWMRPIGTGGKKKLSDIFSDMKLNVDEKDEAVVIVSPGIEGKNTAGEHVAAVCGYASGRFYCRVDEAVKATSGTSCLVCLEFI